MELVAERGVDAAEKEALKTMELGEMREQSGD